MQADTQILYVRLTWSDVVTGEGRELIAPLPVSFGRAQDNTVVLNSNEVSRRHAVLKVQDGGVMLEDQRSTNGTYVNQDRITQVSLPSGAGFRMGPFHLIMTVEATPPQSASVQPSATAQSLDRSAAFSQSFLGSLKGVPLNESTLVFSPKTGNLLPLAPKTREESLPLGGLRQPVIPMREVHNSRLPVMETTYLAVGGGIGSFAWADHLRIYGVPAEQIIALGLEPLPIGRYSRLCRNSQIPGHERLRSNSDSCPDNIWGWPSYGLREIWHSMSRGQVGNALRVAGQVFGEPVITDTYTPRSGDVFQAVEREARRIGWDRIFRYGRALAVRKTDDGRYVVAYTWNDEHGQAHQQFAVAPNAANQLELVDRNGSAVAQPDGFLKTTITSYWTTSASPAFFQETVRVFENVPLARDTFRVRLECPRMAQAFRESARERQPGTFACSSDNPARRPGDGSSLGR